MPMKAQAASIHIAPTPFADRMEAPLPEAFALAPALLVACAFSLLEAVRGKTLATEGVTEPLAVVAETVLLMVALVVEYAREYEVAVQAAKDVELVQVVSSETKPEGVAVPMVL